MDHRADMASIKTSFNIFYGTLLGVLVPALVLNLASHTSLRNAFKEQQKDTTKVHKAVKVDQSSNLKRVSPKMQ